MSERFRYMPPEERGERPLPKTADFRYAYRGYYDEGGICRVRLFRAEALPRPPVIVVSQLEENRNTSVTIMWNRLSSRISYRRREACVPRDQLL